MAATIFYRERTKDKKGAKTPRFRVVAVSGLELNLCVSHLRQSELEQIARVCGAELVALNGGEKHRERKKQ
ncbi:MAG: hypothetical protein CSA21_00870 [Deltaproteobacteria bacterium]|nr:MAG: hypothetical protein CSA21_00870 [Deltaproteobacteria bacterium]